MASSSLHQMIFAAEGVQAGALAVREFTGREGLSELYAFDVTLEAPNTDFNPRALLLHAAQVGVIEADGGAVVRRFAGVVARVREEVSVVGAPRLRFTVTIEPAFSILRLTTDYRIFQGKSTRDIVSELLDEAGVPAARVSWRLTGSYLSREVCTQYGETGFAFVSRLLEEDGIFYFFEHGDEGETLVFGDASSAYAAMTPAELPFRPASGLASAQAVLVLVERERVRPVKVTLRDHDFKRPALDLEAKAGDDGPLGREHYAYPGRYVDPGEGQRRAKLRLDALDCEARGVGGESSAPSLSSGHTFTLAESPEGSFDHQWLVVDVTHTWRSDSVDTRYRNRFRLLPGDVTYRPVAATPRAIVRGPQIARVTGPAGEEIHCDEHGRIKVYFPWDRRSTRDDKSSAWVRVGQMPTSGSVAIPRIGWEVLVEFEDGDPDRPIVVGRLYNGIYTPPYTLPQGKTMTGLKSASSPGGGGHNEIRMDDSSGGEHVHMHAQKDLNLTVANNKTEKVATSSVHSVGSNHKLTVGGNETLSVGDQYELNVVAAQTWAVGGSRSKTIGGSEAITVKGSRTTTIGGSHTTMTPMTVATATPAALSETIGGSCIEAAAVGVAMAAAGVASITVGGAKIEAVATGKTDVTLGARASTVGGAFLSVSGADVKTHVGGVKATTVGGVWSANAAGEISFGSDATLAITVGGAVAMNAASITLKVGGSSVTLSAGQVVIKSSEIKLIATGPHAELAPMVEDI